MPRNIHLLSLILLGMQAGASAQPRDTDRSTPPSLMPGASSQGLTLLASHSGAALNSNLLSGGGIDDTGSLQRVLDQAKDGRPVHLIIDGPALVRGLDVYGNTTIECIEGGGLYLKPNSSRAIIRNSHRSRTTISDEHITIRGCFLNGDHDHQPGSSGTPANQEADGTFITGLQFLGVNDLTIEDTTLWNCRAFGAWISNADRITIRNVLVDHGGPLDIDMHYANTDGLHFTGPVRYLTIDDVKLRTGDDGLAFNANDSAADDMTVHNDMGPYVGQGPITDVAVNNVVLIDAANAIRFLSSNERIDRIVISNVTGTLNGNAFATISHYMSPSLGNIGSILLDNIAVHPSDHDPKISLEWSAIVKGANKAVNDEFNGGVSDFISVNARVENLVLRNFSTKVTDARPIIRIGPDADVGQMTVALNLLDDDLRGVPLELDAGGRIKQLNMSLNWKGKTIDQGKNAIVSLGGLIEQLHWVSTPPTYVVAELSDGNAVTVTFSENIKATDAKAGVRILVNDRTAEIAHTFSDPGHPNLLHFVLKNSVRPGDTVTWAYDAATGSIQNWSGDQLLSVTRKAIANR